MSVNDERQQQQLLARAGQLKRYIEVSDMRLKQAAGLLEIDIDGLVQKMEATRSITDKEMRIMAEAFASWRKFECARLQKRIEYINAIK